MLPGQAYQNDVFGGRGNLDVCSLYKVAIKVSLSHRTLTDYVYTRLRRCCDDLKQYRIFSHDIDHTHDISGIFLKEQFIEYLLTHEGF